MSEANTKEASVDPKAGAEDKRREAIPFFAVPEVLDGFTEQNRARAKENYEKMKVASGEITNVVREACSTNAKGAAEYAAKVIEFSGANASSAFDFLSDLMSTKSPAEALQLSITQSRKQFEATTAQNRELWELARKVATETAEPIKKKFAGVLQKAS